MDRVDRSSRIAKPLSDTRLAFWKTKSQRRDQPKKVPQKDEAKGDEANLVERGQDWEWSSLKPTVRSGPEGMPTDSPIQKPS